MIFIIANVLNSARSDSISFCELVSSGPPVRMLLIPGTGNGERGTGNGELGTGVWERVYSGNSLENSKWRTKQKKRPQESTEETI